MSGLSEQARDHIRDLGREAGRAYLEHGTPPKPIHDLWTGHPWSRTAAVSWWAGFHDITGDPTPLPK